MSDIEIGSSWVNRCDGVEAIVESVGSDCVGFTQVINGKEYFYNHAVEEFKEYYEPLVQADTPRAVQILNEAVAIMAERGKSYDKSGGEAERSMPKIVAMFNALTGHELTPEQGWKFMCCLKLVRSEQGEYREDNYLDGAAYMALAGEEAEASSE